MGALANVVGGLWKPLALGLLVLVALGLMSDDSGFAAGKFNCSGFTNDPDLNRIICQYHPVRIWNTPVTELLPFLAPATETAAN
ncbi:hypothetical protein CLV78_10819 [Aliiruegeria haliotis]|uniref:Uncharacterized protein n=1 Tax=Aliiruegeria haliotis TaxID=1280846 RepID=A0A2T0RKV3_9RHOB|nr:hypothetical protein [Aliiruegeria haliotis]PRY21750.1 hypothetical protein CLV78_10819 [Aliiruegeria haliotis]